MIRNSFFPSICVRLGIKQSDALFYISLTFQFWDEFKVSTMPPVMDG